MSAHDPACPLCREPGGLPVWQDADWRVIRADEPAFPGFYRVVLQRHVAEWSDLDTAARQRGMALVVAVERVLREKLQPAKINLAALGNLVPHLHWHVVPRFADDSHFPQPIWGSAQRPPDAAALARRAALLPALDRAVAQALDAA
ncbi:HIT family protein [Piscinibacter sakaiensis]|uniref:Diadenosine tetraphosphate Ap4A hydrolase n=1 Tax=Piscinibacter sakaiensis TaxID=1547922 RepID=A0A0K8NY73_PISS1|nr:HIT family protein [Piscinibacter sakaiensis]GAP35323.1 diadenosine tetraphosphate Ap4A hydrolase [Piscinibacter sakaiensis]